ncbi:MAG: penicillin-binding transpeptidase domain-containing protein [Phycisphaerae bacterium]|nr:penicillin-binding transpeptidase domain-containing protein [Phycisphaerae bacterium]
MLAIGFFHRRLLLLLTIFLIIGVSLAAQLGRLAIIEGSEHSRQTETFLRRRTFLPFVRGSILDRNGVTLAEDRASWDVQVEYAVIAGRWAAEKARFQARRDLGATAWQKLSRDERNAEAEARRAQWDLKAERLFAELCTAGGFDRAELERRFDEIRRRVAPRVEAYRDRMRRAEEAKAAASGSAPLPIAEDETISEQEEPHTILADVDDMTAFRFQALGEEERDTLVVVPATRRVRPWDEVDVPVDRSALPGPLRTATPLTIRLEGVADHLLGTTRTSVFIEDLTRRPFLDARTGEVADLGGYRADRDLVGARGMERTLEDRLRGARGIVERNLETGDSTRRDALPGADVRLTIDIKLQSWAQAALDPELGLAKIQQWQRGWTADGEPKQGVLPVGWELNGAAVVIEIETGDVLALVSTPTLRESTALPSKRRRVEGADINKAVEGVYPPGSIVKPLLFTGAVTQGVFPADSIVDCKGHFFENVTSFARCWIWRPEEGRTSTHGPLGAEEAIARSCNVYFYTVASKLGLEGAVQWYRNFGVGRPVDIGLAIGRDTGRNSGGGPVRYEGEAAGSVPSAEEMQAIRASGDRAAAVFLGIGQGPVTWTPLHAASAYATLARGGRVVRPSLLLDRPSRGVTTEDLGLNQVAVRKSIDGLRKAVSESYGTGHHVTLESGEQQPISVVPGVRIWAKSGTAQAPPLKIDNDHDGTPETSVQTDHAWFVGLAGDEADGVPRYAIAVLVEHGGSGGKTAGPVAAEIIRAMVREGYLGASAATKDRGS